MSFLYLFFVCKNGEFDDFVYIFFFSITDNQFGSQFEHCNEYSKTDTWERNIHALPSDPIIQEHSPATVCENIKQVKII